MTSGCGNLIELDVGYMKKVLIAVLIIIVGTGLLYSQTEDQSLSNIKAFVGSSLYVSKGDIPQGITITQLNLFFRKSLFNHMERIPSYTDSVDFSIYGLDDLGLLTCECLFHEYDNIVSFYLCVEIESLSNDTSFYRNNLVGHCPTNIFYEVFTKDLDGQIERLGYQLYLDKGWIKN